MREPAIPPGGDEPPNPSPVRRRAWQFEALAPQFVQFATVGVMNTAVDAAVFAVVVATLGWTSGALAVAASTIGFVCGAANSYLWNSRVTFALRHDGDSPSRLARFVAVMAGGLVASAAVFAFALGLSPGGTAALVAAKAAAIAAGTLWNFTLMRQWVFRSP